MAVDRSKLVPKKVLVHGEKKTFQAIRYFSAVGPKEIKGRVKEFLKEREKKSKYTRYLDKHATPDYVDVFNQEDLKASIEVKTSKKGVKSQFYSGVNVENIKRVIEFKKPETLDGSTRLIQLVPEFQKGRTLVQYTDEAKTKRKTKIFKRAVDTGDKIKPFLEKMGKWIKEKGTSQNKQLAVILRIMLAHDIRVGSGGGIKEGSMPVGEIKRGMAVVHESWKPGTMPHVTVIKDDKIYLRNIEKAEAQVAKIKELKKSPDKSPVMKERIKMLQEEFKKFPHPDFNIPMPANWKEVIRVGHYGATELEARHVKQDGSKTTLEFIGKSNRLWRKEIKDSDVKQAIKDLLEGKTGDDQLFPDVMRRHVATQLNKYKVYPHDFRRYDATKSYIEESRNYPTPLTEKEATKIERQIFEKVAARINDTPGMAKTYIAPNIMAAWRAGKLPGMVAEAEVQKSFAYVIMFEDLQKTVRRE